MNTLIAESEELSVRRLRKLLCAEPDLFRVVGETADMAATEMWISRNRAAGYPDPDLIFFDIELPYGRYLESFRRMDVKSVFVFTTSYDEHVLQAFNANAIDYLLKPVHRDDLFKLLEKRLQTNSIPGGTLWGSMSQLFDDLRKKRR